MGGGADTHVEGEVYYAIQLEPHYGCNHTGDTAGWKPAYDCDR